ncbi:hypothetical protein MRX96_025585 [Rhipicephalus microplus]
MPFQWRASRSTRRLRACGCNPSAFAPETHPLRQAPYDLLQLSPLLFSSVNYQHFVFTPAASQEVFSSACRSPVDRVLGFPEART